MFYIARTGLPVSTTCPATAQMDTQPSERISGLPEHGSGILIHRMGGTMDYYGIDLNQASGNQTLGESGIGRWDWLCSCLRGEGPSFLPPLQSLTETDHFAQGLGGQHHELVLLWEIIIWGFLFFCSLWDFSGLTTLVASANRGDQRKHAGAGSSDWCFSGGGTGYQGRTSSGELQQKGKST